MSERPKELDVGIRETVNKRSGATAGLMCGLIVAAIGIAVWSFRGPGSRASTAYYADETGKSFFADDIDRVYPFDHDGKPAYRAYVYRGADGKEFVAYLARYNDAAHAKLLALADKKNDPTVAGELAAARNWGIEVKRPGDEKWVDINSSQGTLIARHPKLPDGSTAQPIMP